MSNFVSEYSAIGHTGQETGQMVEQNLLVPDNFRQSTVAYRPVAITASVVVVVVRSSVHHKVGSSCNSRTVSPRINKFSPVIHTDLVYSYTGSDVISYFWSAVVGGKTIENAVFDGLWSYFSRTV